MSFPFETSLSTTFSLGSTQFWLLYYNFKPKKNISTAVVDISTYRQKGYHDVITAMSMFQDGFDRKGDTGKVRKRWSICATTYLWQMYPIVSFDWIEKKGLSFCQQLFFFDRNSTCHFSPEIFKNTQGFYGFLQKCNSRV